MMSFTQFRIFAAITLHEEVVDLVVEVLLLERNEVLPVEISVVSPRFRTASSVIISLKFVS